MNKYEEAVRKRSMMNISDLNAPIMFISTKLCERIQRRYNNGNCSNECVRNFKRYMRTEQILIFENPIAISFEGIDLELEGMSLTVNQEHHIIRNFIYKTQDIYEAIVDEMFNVNPELFVNSLSKVFKIFTAVVYQIENCSSNNGNNLMKTQRSNYAMKMNKSAVSEYYINYIKLSRTNCVKKQYWILNKGKIKNSSMYIPVTVEVGSYKKITAGGVKVVKGYKRTVYIRKEQKIVRITA